MRLVIPVVVICLLMPDIAAGQSPAGGLTLGDRVRLVVRGRHVDGTVSGLSGDSITLAVTGSTAVVVAPIDSVSGVQRWNGTRGHAGTGALVGFVLGAISGAGAFSGLCGSLQCNDQAGSAVAGGVLGGVVGMGLGALLGLAVRTDRWVALPGNGVRIAPAPGPGRLGFQAAIRF